VLHKYSGRHPLAPEDADWVGFNLVEQPVNRAGIEVVILVPPPVAIGPVQAAGRFVPLTIRPGSRAMEADTRRC
jgi:hypothetical protein